MARVVDQVGTVPFRGTVHAAVAHRAVVRVVWWGDVVLKHCDGDVCVRFAACGIFCAWCVSAHTRVVCVS